MKNTEQTQSQFVAGARRQLFVGFSARRGAWLLCAVALLPPAALSALLAGCGHSHQVNANPNAAPTVAAVRVARRSIANNLEIASEFQPFQEIDIYAKVSGYIKKLNIDWGSHVRQGEVLAVLEIPELEQELQLDEAAVKRSEQDLERAREEMHRAQSAYKVANLTYSRLAEVQKTQPGLVAQQEIDVAEGKNLEAEASLSGAKAGLSAAEQVLNGARAALNRDKAMFAYSRIAAPFAGVVTQMQAYTGALLPAGTSSNKGGQALCRLSQISLLRLVIPVPERAVADIHLGQTLAVNVSALKQTFPGRIVRYSGQIDTATRTMHTEVNVPNPKYELVPGMYASVTIPLRAAENALTVPVQSVLATGAGEGTVLVVDRSGRIEKREVKLGVQTANSFEVLSGLEENETVILGEQGQYKPGDVVTPKFVEPVHME